MLLTVVRVYQQGRKLSEKELRSAEGVVGDVRTHSVLINRKDVHKGRLYGREHGSTSAADRTEVYWDEYPCAWSGRLRGREDSRGNRVLPPRLVVRPR